MRRCAVALSLLLLAASAHADDANQEAKDLFHGGAQAYAVGQFEQAVKYLDAAYALSPQPAILFSLSQALRRAYAKDQNPATLARALAGFRKYLAEVPQGPRVKDAAAAVTELEMIGKQHGAEAPPVDPTTAPNVSRQAELIVTSGTKGSFIEVDGQGQLGDDGQAAPEFWSGSLEPGVHTIRVHATGYFDVSRSVRLVAGRPHAIDIGLQAKPARLVVKAPPGTRVQIDGRIAAETPLTGALEVTPGVHVVSLLKNGHVAQTTELDLARGGTATLDRPLVTSTQRKIAYGFAGAGAASLVASALFFGAALDREAHAKSLLETRQSRALSTPEADDYEAARVNRSRYRTSGLIWLGAGAGLEAIGALLYLFDQPRAGEPRPLRPTVGLGSVGLSGRF